MNDYGEGPPKGIEEAVKSEMPGSRGHGGGGEPGVLDAQNSVQRQVRGVKPPGALEARGGGKRGKKILGPPISRRKQRQADAGVASQEGQLAIMRYRQIKAQNPNLSDNQIRKIMQRDGFRV